PLAGVRAISDSLPDSLTVRPLGRRFLWPRPLNHKPRVPGFRPPRLRAPRRWRGPACPRHPRGREGRTRLVHTAEISVRHLPRALLAASASSGVVTVRSVSHFEISAPLTGETRPKSMSRRVYVTLPLTRVLSATSRPGRRVVACIVMVSCLQG